MIKFQSIYKKFSMEEELLYTKYMNIIECFKTYRKTPINETIDKETFKKKMYQDNYILMKIKDPISYIYFFEKKSIYVNQYSTFIRPLIEKIPPPATVYFITNEEMNSKNIRKIKNKFIPKGIKFMFWRHRNFASIIFDVNYTPQAARVVNGKELTELESSLKIAKENLPYLSVDDPLNIWINAKVGDVVEITSLSYNSLTSVRYRYVVSDQIVARIKQMDAIDAEENMDEVGDIVVDNEVTNEVDMGSEVDIGNDIGSEAEAASEVDAASDVDMGSEVDAASDAASDVDIGSDVDSDDSDTEDKKGRLHKEKNKGGKNIYMDNILEPILYTPANANYNDGQPLLLSDSDDSVEYVDSD